MNDNKLYKLENLTIDELNIIFGSLGQQPYQNVFNLLPKLQNQIQSQRQRQRQDDSEKKDNLKK
jgi:hypothetical protein